MSEQVKRYDVLIRRGDEFGGMMVWASEGERAKLEAAEKERNDAVRSYGRAVHKRIEAMAILRSLIHCIEQLMGDTEGVAGLHMNGDVAPWSELVRGGRYEEWLEAFDTAREWIASQDHQVVDQDERTGR